MGNCVNQESSAVQQKLHINAHGGLSSIVEESHSDKSSEIAIDEGNSN